MPDPQSYVSDASGGPRRPIPPQAANDRQGRSDLGIIIAWVLDTAPPGSPAWLAAARLNNERAATVKMWLDMADRVDREQQP